MSATPANDVAGYARGSFGHFRQLRALIAVDRDGAQLAALGPLVGLAHLPSLVNARQLRATARPFSGFGRLSAVEDEVGICGRRT